MISSIEPFQVPLAFLPFPECTCIAPKHLLCLVSLSGAGSEGGAPSAPVTVPAIAVSACLSFRRRELLIPTIP